MAKEFDHPIPSKISQDERMEREGVGLEVIPVEGERQKMVTAGRDSRADWRGQVEWPYSSRGERGAMMMINPSQVIFRAH